MTITNEQFEKIQNAKNPEELITLAKAEGIEFTKEKAEDIFHKITAYEGELSVEELENIAGGKNSTANCRHCNTENNTDAESCSKCGATDWRPNVSPQLTY